MFSTGRILRHTQRNDMMLNLLINLEMQEDRQNEAGARWSKTRGAYFRFLLYYREIKRTSKHLGEFCVVTID